LREETARTVANIVLATAAIGAAVVVLRTPSLRRLAVGLARTALTTTLPIWLSREVKQAWDASAPAADRGSRSADSRAAAL